MRYSLFGESHGPAIGVVLQGVPSGLALDMEFIRAEMARRAPGNSPLATARSEKDAVRIVSGVFEDRTCGTPLCGLIENTDTRSRDYAATRYLARPGHADFTAHLRYGGFEDYRGGGHFSGRLTAPLVFAGAVAKLALRQKGMEIFARIRETAGVEDAPLDLARPDVEALRAAGRKSFAVIDDARGEAMQKAILEARAEGDSVGGVIECFALGLPAGLGSPDMDENIETAVARHVFAVPAVKGLSFGSGFGFSSMRGSEANDAFVPGESIRTRTNHNGGINGGISNGMPVVFSVVIKPTPSIAREQDTVDMRTGEAAKLVITGRHDPCILPRAVPVIEAACALALSEVPGVLS
ncbi:chorismate synthase [uncultured Mailhella sp.]|uniref:chorismate synthase n=1 Tax=uncultured Mailhella sp. TaxID=1981031 RepID=UPI0025CCB5C3|nr:chorismate synthase [uncultured Mailhella sp.]